MNRVIAVDFDGTLCRSKWPDIGEENWDVIKALKKRQEDGDILILWTCRSGDLLNAAIMWCLARGIKFDAVNDNCKQRVEMYGNNPRKVSADEYWDDRGITVCGGRVWYPAAYGLLPEIRASENMDDGWKAMKEAVNNCGTLEMDAKFTKKSRSSRMMDKIGAWIKCRH